MSYHRILLSSWLSKAIPIYSMHSSPLQKRFIYNPRSALRPTEFDVSFTCMKIHNL